MVAVGLQACGVVRLYQAGRADRAGMVAVVVVVVGCNHATIDDLGATCLPLLGHSRWRACRQRS
jgi:hypothetical protein